MNVGGTYCESTNSSRVHGTLPPPSGGAEAMLTIMLAEGFAVFVAVKYRRAPFTASVSGFQRTIG